jgi:hypothetical protein
MTWLRHLFTIGAAVVALGVGGCGTTGGSVFDGRSAQSLLFQLALGLGSPHPVVIGSGQSPTGVRYLVAGVKEGPGTGGYREGCIQIGIAPLDEGSGGTCYPLPAGKPLAVTDGDCIDNLSVETGVAIGGARQVQLKLWNGHILRARLFTIPDRLASGAVFFLAFGPKSTHGVTSATALGANGKPIATIPTQPVGRTCPGGYAG